ENSPVHDFLASETQVWRLRWIFMQLQIWINVTRVPVVLPDTGLDDCFEGGGTLVVEPLRCDEQDMVFPVIELKAHRLDADLKSCLPYSRTGDVVREEVWCHRFQPGHLRSVQKEDDGYTVVHVLDRRRDGEEAHAVLHLRKE